MPHHDQVPDKRQAHYERAALAWDRYKIMMRRMALVAISAALLSLTWLWLSGAPMRLHMMIAVFAGVALTVLVGTGLMGLVFLSSRTGHDDAAAGGGQNDE